MVRVRRARLIRFDASVQTHVTYASGPRRAAPLTSHFGVAQHTHTHMYAGVTRVGGRIYAGQYVQRYLCSFKACARARAHRQRESEGARARARGEYIDACGPQVDVHDCSGRARVRTYAKMRLNGFECCARARVRSSEHAPKTIRLSITARTTAVLYLSKVMGAVRDGGVEENKNS